MGKNSNKFECVSAQMRELQGHIEILHESYLEQKTITSTAADDRCKQHILRESNCPHPPTPLNPSGLVAVFGTHKEFLRAIKMYMIRTTAYLSLFLKLTYLTI